MLKEGGALHTVSCGTLAGRQKPAPRRGPGQTLLGPGEQGGDARVPGLPDFTPPYSSSCLLLQLLCLQTLFPALHGQTPAQPKSPLPCQAFPGPPFDLVHPSGPCLLAPAPDSAWSLLHLSPGAMCQGQALAWTWDISPLALNQRGR